MTKELIHGAMAITGHFLTGTGTGTGTGTAVRGGLGHQEVAALDRAARIEALLGDPYEPGNPHGFKALFAADHRREPPVATEELLAGAGLGAEFVPVGYGGRLTRADLLAKVLRPVFRRDVMLGFGFGITSLFAGSAVWAAGTDSQRRWMSSVLLAGERAAILHHKLAHANAILRDEFTAWRMPGGYVLDGRKDVIINAERAGAYVVYARTGSAHSGRSHSVLLVDPAQLPSGRVRRLPRVAVNGARGGLFSGLEFTQCPVGEALVGGLGEGVALALRTFQVNRCLISSVVTAAAETVLHSAVRAATTGRSRPIARRWHTPLAGVFADLLVCDSMATVALRCLSLLPERAHILAAAVKYVVPGLLREDLEELATVLGSRGYEHDSAEYGALGKLARDLHGAGLGHAGTAACQAVIVPQLRRLARRSWFVEEEPPPQLFGGPGLPDLDYQLLRIADGGDVLAASLVATAARLTEVRGVDTQMAVLSDLAQGFVGELRTLQATCRQLPPIDAGTLTDPALCVLSDRYALVLAAAAVLGIWEGQDGSSPFLTAPAWAVLALSRIGSRLGLPVPDLPDGCVGQVLEELVDRYRSGRGCDLDATQFLQ